MGEPFSITSESSHTHQIIRKQRNFLTMGANSSSKRKKIDFRKLHTGGIRPVQRHGNVDDAGPVVPKGMSLRNYEAYGTVPPDTSREARRAQGVPNYSLRAPDQDLNLDDGAIAARVEELPPPP